MSSPTMPEAGSRARSGLPDEALPENERIALVERSAAPLTAGFAHIAPFSSSCENSMTSP